MFEKCGGAGQQQAQPGGIRFRSILEDASPLFHQELRLTVLNSGAVVGRGLSKLRVLLGEPTEETCQPGKRVFFEPESGQGPTFCLDMYDADKSPGLGSKGFTADVSEPVVALYRVEKNTVNQVWVCDDEDRLAANPSTSKAGLTASDTWDKVAEVVRDNIKGGIKCHFSNYAETEDAAGLGVGSSSKITSFTI